MCRSGVSLMALIHPVLVPPVLALPVLVPLVLLVLVPPVLAPPVLLVLPVPVSSLWRSRQEAARQ